MGDEPIAGLGNRTPLQHAATPAMDSIAADGCSGTLLTLPEGFSTSSEVANMSVLGCCLETEYSGRGPLEAAGNSIPLIPGDRAFRLNLTTVESGVLTDFSGGHIEQHDAETIIELLNHHFGSNVIRFYPGVSYRSILVLSGPEFSHRLKTEKPDDNHGQRVVDHLPTALKPEAETTASFLRRLMQEAPALLEQSPVNKRLTKEGKPPANGVWPWNGGQAASLVSLKEKYGIESSAVISAVAVIIGLGRCLGMDVITVPGATGYIDTNYEGKADAAIDALKTHDFVYVHVEAPDEVSHAQDLDLKLQAIEDFDSRVIARTLSAVGNDVNVAVLPDHPVPLSTGRHTRTPVPVAARISGREPDAVTVFDEIACKSGSLGAMRNGDLMALLFG